MTSLRSKLNQLKPIEKTTTISKEEQVKEVNITTSYFEALFINGIWYGMRNNKCYMIGVTLQHMAFSHYKYERPKLNSSILPEYNFVDTEDEEYLRPISNWTPFRKGWSFRGKVINNLIVPDVDYINDQKLK